VDITNSHRREDGDEKEGGRRGVRGKENQGRSIGERRKQIKKNRIEDISPSQKRYCQKEKEKKIGRTER